MVNNLYDYCIGYYKNKLITNIISLDTTLFVEQNNISPYK